MENKITKAYFIERLKDILAVEKTARENYIQDIKIFKNMKLKTVIEKIKKLPKICSGNFYLFKSQNY